MSNTPIPDWLFAPQAHFNRPPINKRLQGLPFEELSWPDFERLLLRVVATDREVLDCRVYGSPGQAQHGIDLLAAQAATPDVQTCYQCKKVETFRPSDVRKAIKKFEEGPWADLASEFTLCTACPLESTNLVNAIRKERTRLATHNITLRVWDGSLSGELNVRLKALPEIVDDFFGREWVGVFNGPESADRLAERLDGYDFAVLRERLSELYCVIFSQHDPGLRHRQAEPSNYVQRYVSADIVESAMVELKQSSMRGAVRFEGVESIGAPSTDQLDELRQKTTTPTIGKYSVRRPIWEWLRDKDNCVVLGDPGHGKSAFLRHLTLVLNTKDFMTDMPLRGEHLRRLPVWISFSRFAAAMAKQPMISVEDFFCAWLHQYGYGDTQPLFRRALSASKFVLLVDGLDEAAETSECREALDRIVTFGKSHRAIIICTSRPRPFASLPVPQSWPSTMLAPLDDGQIEELAVRWFAIVESASPDELDEARQTQAKLRGKEFITAIIANTRTNELARNPLLCQALIELFRLSHRLPEARVRAYWEIIDLFLRRHPQARAHASFMEKPATLEGLRDADLQDILIKIAFDTQSASASGIAPRNRCVDLCAEYLEDDLKGLGLPRSKSARRALEIIELLIEHFGILIERSPGELSFVHLSLQEFLAAKAVTAMSESKQLEWVQAIALQEHWRECLTSWFGIQGEIGHRELAATASGVLKDIGRSGEWERLQTLSLRVELSSADLGLPVSEARKVLVEAIQEVDTSPFPDLRSKLARNIAVGALGSSIKEECTAAIARWTPARSRYDRASLLKAFGEWSASDDLEKTLRRALHDESVLCRRAAAESYAQVFAVNPKSQSYLFSIAKWHIRPEVRAAAIHALSQILEWSDVALEAVEWNIRSHSPELLLSCISMRVRMKKHTSDDLKKLLAILAADSLDFTLRDELNMLICNGWPRNESLRSKCLHFVQKTHGTGDLEFPLEYLISSYQNDSEIAKLIADLFGRYGMHIGPERGRMWVLLRENYAENEIVVPAMRSALANYKERYASIIWHPNIVPVYLVLADDQARDELIESYCDADPNERFWIASTLIEGWPQDSLVQKQLHQWVNESVNHAAPLVIYAKDIKPIEAERLDWLEWLVGEADRRILKLPIFSLIEERPDDRTYSLISERLHDSKLWYYSRIEIEAKLAAVYPGREQSHHTVERAFAESDGPNLGTFASAYQDDTAIRPRLLKAAAPAPDDVRLSIVSVLMERGGTPDLIESLTPDVLTEETSAVRAAALIARARSYRHDFTSSTSFSELLSVEATSIGMKMDLRNRTAVAALLELGEVDRVAQIFADKNRIRPSIFADSLDSDLVSLGAILDHWQELQVATAARNIVPFRQACMKRPEK